MNPGQSQWSQIWSHPDLTPDLTSYPHVGLPLQSLESGLQDITFWAQMVASGFLQLLLLVAVPPRSESEPCPSWASSLAVVVGFLYKELPSH